MDESPLADFLRHGAGVNKPNRALRTTRGRMVSTLDNYMGQLSQTERDAFRIAIRALDRIIREDCSK